MSFSPDGTLLAVGNGTVWLYDVVSGREPRALKGDPFNVAFSPNGTMLAAGMHGGKAILWDMTSLQVLGTFRNANAPGYYTLVAFSPDGKLLALGDMDASLWKVTTGALIRTISQDTNTVIFLSDGKLLATSKGCGTSRQATGCAILRLSAS